MAFDWIEQASRATAGELADWLGGTYEDDRLYVIGALGAHYVQVYLRDGEPDSLTAGYAVSSGLTLAHLEAELGPGRELPRGPAGPFQLAFGGGSIIALTYAPPGPERQLVELTVRRS